MYWNIPISVRSIVDTRCVACHAAQPKQEGFAQPPKGIVLETNDQVAANADEQAGRPAKPRCLANAEQTIPLAMVCLFGFALCPYLDLTFHRARLDVVELVGGDAPVVVQATLVAAHALTATRCELEIKPPLAGPLKRESVVVHANVALASHGESVSQVLGSGDFGVVYQARDAHESGAGAMVAIKEMPKQSIIDCERQADVRALLHHPAIPCILGYFSTDKHSYLVHDLVVGWDLETVLDRQSGFAC